MNTPSTSSALSASSFRKRLVQASRLALVSSVGALPIAAVNAAAPSQKLAISAGSQQELIIDKGIDRLAIADETVASITLTRKDKGAANNAARLIVTGKAPGSTTLMVWEKGNSAATTYVIEVARRAATVEGTFDSVPAQRAVADVIVGSYPKDSPVVDKSVVNVRSHTVQVEVRIVEFSRSVLKEVGFTINGVNGGRPYGPNSHGFSFSSTSPNSSSIAGAFSLVLGLGRVNGGRGVDLGLNFLESNGLARVLAEPTLVAMSGQSASFLAGGELPVPVSQSLGTTTIQYKPFGIGLTVSPTVLSNDRIALKVAPEASDLDYANAVNVDGLAVPAITTRRADTTVELGDGESFVIGGLVSRSTVSNASKVPLLGDLPIIGNFFKQQSYTMNEKELVIVVTPRLVKPLARGTDIASRLPGGAEQRDGPVWSVMLGGGIGTGSVLPGFSK